MANTTKRLLKKLRLALLSWEIGRTGSGLGTKIGGLGGIVEELPAELVKAAAKQGIDLSIEILTPCFAHYDKSRLTKVDVRLPVTIEGHGFEFEAYEYIFPDGQKAIYFWDSGQLGWTNATAVYPYDPQMAIKLYAAVGQAMAAYIEQGNFDTIHMHDHHVGLTPFYLSDAYLRDVPIHFTIHNATYQGIVELVGGGYNSLNRLNLPGEKLFHKYFDFFDHLNPTKACMLKVYENGGKITTVSGDLAGTWGYAAELKESHAAVWDKACAQKGSPPIEVFVPNRHLDLFERLSIAGITNGLSDRNRPEYMPELTASTLKEVQKKRGRNNPIFNNPTVQRTMLKRDHNFDINNLKVKTKLKHLLHLETFGTELQWNSILITTVGRLVEQKNLGLVAEVVERVLAYDGGAKFIILASAPDGDEGAKATENHFWWLASMYPDRVYFNNTFNLPLSKLIMAGGDFMLIPSRFEPCGLVDYEASLLGNIVIGRATGGLVKVRDCAYMYEWYDIGDRAGEANALFWQVKFAIDDFRHNPAQHAAMRRKAMSIDASWDSSAAQYINMYRYGFLTKEWFHERKDIVRRFINLLDDDRDLFSEFFHPGHGEYGDELDWELRDAL